jgi:cytoskeleton protein RodZ
MTEMSQENAALGIGEALREARKKKQQSLNDISTLLKIREDHLQALEDENFAILPGDAYAIGFIRTYANHLELNSAELVTRFKESREKPQFDETNFEPDVEAEPMSALLKIGIGVAAVFVVYLAWLVSAGPVQRETTSARSNANDDSATQNTVAAATPQATETVVVAPVVAAPQAVSPPRPAQPALQAIVPEPTKKPAQKPAVKPASPAAQAEKAPQSAIAETPSAPAPTQPLPLDAASAIDSLSPRVSVAALPQTANGASSAAAEADIAGQRVEIRAKRRTWMRLENDAGRVLFSSIISPGDSFALQDEGDYTLATRDAGALEFSVNGRTIGNVGRRGQILTSRRVSRDDILARDQ